MANKDKGFIVKCNKCGNEIDANDYFYEQQILLKKEIQVKISWGYEEGLIKCNCGNYIEF